jgi:hypothetical protein
MERARTLDGPVALRSVLSAETVDGGDLYLVGPALTLELSVKPFGRIDIGAGVRGGELEATGRITESLELELGFSRRFVLTNALDLDAGVAARAGVLTLGGVSGVDDIAGQAQTWWSRALASVRIQPRLSRELRLDAGVSGGLVLREVPFELASGGRDDFGGAFFGAELGVVFTPKYP